MIVSTASAARLARVSVRIIRTWCRSGRIAATKLRGRWVVRVASLRDLLAQLRPIMWPAPTGRHRKGVAVPPRTGRAARVRTGHHMSAQRQVAVLDALVARVNTGRITAAEYLTGVLGADEEFVRRYASPFGRHVAQAYRAAFGMEPAKAGLARRGTRLVPCFAYTAAEVPVLYEAALAYGRTRELLSGRRESVLLDLVAA